MTMVFMQIEKSSEKVIKIVAFNWDIVILCVKITIFHDLVSNQYEICMSPG